MEDPPLELGGIQVSATPRPFAGLAGRFWGADGTVPAGGVGVLVGVAVGVLVGVAVGVAVAAVGVLVGVAVGVGVPPAPPQPGKLTEAIQVLQSKPPLLLRYSVVYQKVQSSTASTLRLL